MRTIGGHDYYDHACPDAQDAIVFVRHADCPAWDGPHPFPLPPPAWRREAQGCLTYGRAMVGGVLLPFAEWRSPGRTPWDAHAAAHGQPGTHWHSLFVYDLAKALAFLDAIYGPHEARRPWAHPHLPHSAHARAQAHFAHTRLDARQRGWMAGHRVITFTQRQMSPDPAGWLSANSPTLAQVRAWKALDARTAYTHIHTCLGGAARPL